MQNTPLRRHRKTLPDRPLLTLNVGQSEQNSERMPRKFLTMQIVGFPERMKVRP